ncbi:MAG: polysulfide reductase NrfD [Acidobacteriota bacterium]|jgi:Ni/Fe-hydrogenase subunit HybB-like protein
MKSKMMDASAETTVQSLKLPPVITKDVTPGELDDHLLKPVTQKPPLAWFVAFGVTSAAFLIGLACIGYTFYFGIGAWGNNIPVAWAFGIINFVFWVGIGHAGTLISAILLLFRARWRNAISRFSEAMTIFAVICATIFPLIHVGRPWIAFWLAPYPNQRGIWPNFRSPLLWDLFAVNTYFLVSLLFWYLGLAPDLASMRDRARGKLRKFVYAALSFGWRGAARHWRHYEKAYLIIAGLATGLVLSVHSVVSFDFAVSLVPGWHMTIFPPYFVTGAVFAGFAMVLMAMIVVRGTMNLKHLITDYHLDVMNKVILTCSCLMGYAYVMEGFVAWYSMNPYIHHTFWEYIAGTYWIAGWVTITCNIFIPQLLWIRRFRRSYIGMIFVSVCVTIGMWFERFVIIVSSLHQDFLPSSWHVFKPTMIDFGILLGSFGLFFTCVLLFARVLPVIATTEMKMILPGSQPHDEGDES